MWSAQHMHIAHQEYTQECTQESRDGVVRAPQRHNDTNTKQQIQIQESGEGVVQMVWSGADASW